MNHQEMDERMLQKLVEEISLESFGKPFRHKASFNHRLRSTGGRYLLGTHNLEFNPMQWRVHGEEELIRIIKHELCHYHLHLEGKGYRHRDRDFKEWLQKVGGSRYCKPVFPKAKKGFRYELVCESCQMRYPRKKKMNPSRYRCGRCKGTLSLISLNECTIM